MSKKNYNKISTEKKAAPEVVEAVAEVVEETPVKEIPEAVTGVVTNCTKLNIRKEADLTGDILATIPVHSKLQIIASDVTGEWFSVCTESGVKGFCMKKYISTP